MLSGNEVQGTPKVEESENGWYRIVTFSFTARQSEKHQHDMLVVQEELMNKLMASDYVDYENEMAVKFQQAILMLPEKQRNGG